MHDTDRWLPELATPNGSVRRRVPVSSSYIIVSPVRTSVALEFGGSNYAQRYSARNR